MTDTPHADEKRLLGSTDEMRCSTGERERTAATISAAVGDGRLQMDEAEERLESAFGARYRHELDALVADLPEPPGHNSSWRAIALSAREQLSTDIARLLGEGSTRRVRIAIATVIAFLIAVMLVLAVVHGIVDDGPEFPGGRD